MTACAIIMHFGSGERYKMNSRDIKKKKKRKNHFNKTKISVSIIITFRLDFDTQCYTSPSIKDMRKICKTSKIEQKSAKQLLK